MIDDKKCHLLGGIFSSFIQACLAILCITTLMVKRQNEVPRREWFVWFLDVMKQGVGSSFGHFSNIFLSVVIAQSLSGGDECQWYCLTYVIDSTFGTFINLLFLSCFEKVVQHYQYAPEYLNFGEYGDPPNMHVFSLQLAIWLTIVILGKAIILFGLLQLIVPIDNTMSVIFRIFRNHPDLELVMVMIVIPGVLNTLQFWVTDTFLKKQNNTRSNISSGVINGTGASRSSLYRMNSGGTASGRHGHVTLSTNSSDVDLDEELIDGNDDDEEEEDDDMHNIDDQMHTTFLGAFSPGTQRGTKKKGKYMRTPPMDHSKAADSTSQRSTLSSYLTPDTTGLSSSTKLYIVPPTSAITRIYKQTGIPYVWNRVFGSPSTSRSNKGGGGNTNRGSGGGNKNSRPQGEDGSEDDEECNQGSGGSSRSSGVGKQCNTTRSKGNITHITHTNTSSGVINNNYSNNNKSNNNNKQFKDKKIVTSNIGSAGGGSVADASDDAYL